MAVVKKIKNVSGSEKTWAGRYFPDDDVYEIPETEDLHWRSNTGVQTAITSGDAELSDDVHTYTGADALSFLCAIRSNSDRIFIENADTPASASAIGKKGQICWDSSYLYVCVADDIWKRSTLSSW